MVINHSCQQVVSCTDCVEVTSEVKVNVFHRNNLCISAACCSTFYSEYRSKRRLTKCYHNFLADLAHTICQTYGSGSLTFSCRSRVDCSYQNQFSVLSRNLFQQIVVNFCLVLTILLQILVINTCFCSNLGNWSCFALLCNFDVRFESHKNFSFLYPQRIRTLRLMRISRKVCFFVIPKNSSVPCVRMHYITLIIF